jgi:hypothetical protein
VAPRQRGALSVHDGLPWIQALRRILVFSSVAPGCEGAAPRDSPAVAATHETQATTAPARRSATLPPSIMPASSRLAPERRRTRILPGCGRCAWTNVTGPTATLPPRAIPQKRPPAG